VIAAAAPGLASAGSGLPARARRPATLPIGGAEGAALAALVAVAVALRCVRWWQTALMFNDGPTFLWLSRQMSEAHWSSALGHPFHPLYPFLTLLAHFAIPDWERAAAAVSILAGGVAVLFLFLFLRSAFGRREAWFGAALLAVQPRVVDFSADIQSDGLYLALFLGAVLCLWTALRDASPALAGWAGVFTGLAYLTRPEGLGVAIVVGIAAALGFARGSLRPAARAACWVACFSGALALVALPYVAIMRVESGAWQLTGKKSLTALLGMDGGTSPSSGERLQAVPESAPAAEPATAAVPTAAQTPTAAPESAPAPAPAPAPEAAAAAKTQPAPERDVSSLPAPPRALPALWKLLQAASSGLRPWFLALLAIGVFARRGRPGPAGEIVLLFVGLDAAVGLAQLRSTGYLDMRHVLPPLVLTFGYFAAGIDAVAGGLARIGGLASPTGSSSPPAWLTACLLGLAVAAGIGQALRPEPASALAVRAAADWLRANATGEGVVAAPKTRLAYYAGRPGVSLHRAPAAGAVAWLLARQVRYVILDDDDLAHLPALREVPLALLHCVPKGKHWGAVYELRPADAALPDAAVGEAGCASAARDAVAFAPELRAAGEP
jgi:4-amino-4-deoxy-L-arabinose transferase-like glycosyltransferase